MAKVFLKPLNFLSISFRFSKSLTSVLAVSYLSIGLDEKIASAIWTLIFPNVLVLLPLFWT